MYNKNLLLLLITVLLPATQSLSAYHGQKLPMLQQEYGDTDALIASTTQELKHAYDLLEMLKKRSEDITSAGNFSSDTSSSRLPRNFDTIRDEMIKKQLIAVLSATPFSSPEKHIADCKAAIQALEEYSKTLQSSIQSKTAEMKAQPISPELSSAYNITAPTPKPLASEPAPAPLTSTPITSTPITSTPIAPTPIAPAPLAPMSIAPAPITPAPIAPAPLAPMSIPQSPITQQTTFPIAPFAQTTPALQEIPATPAAPATPSLSLALPVPPAPTTNNLSNTLPIPEQTDLFAKAVVAPVATTPLPQAPKEDPLSQPMGADLFTAATDPLLAQNPKA